MNPTKKRLGKVKFHLEYVVDLDNEDMVEHARQALYDDLFTIFKHDEEWYCIEVVEDTSLTEDMIPEFLIEDHMTDDSDADVE